MTTMTEIANPLETALATVRGASVLSTADAGSLEALTPELRQTWDTVQIFRTRTEMEYSVLDDIRHPTPDAKYWQCVREQNVMFCELVGLSYEYRKNDVEKRICALEAELSGLSGWRKTVKAVRGWLGLDGYAEAIAALDRELRQIEIDRRRFAAANMERAAADRMREIRHWREIKAALLPQMKHGVADVDAHQLESLPIRFQRQAAMVTDASPPADRINLLGLAMTAKAREAQPLTYRGIA